MRRLLGILSAAVLALTVTAVPASADAQPNLDFGKELSAATCGPGKLVVNVTQKVLNDADSGVKGNYWALDAVNRHIQVWQTAPGTFCATVAYQGSFNTFAGFSPGGTGTVSAGVRGTLAGGYRTTSFSATLLADPGWPTRGSVGTFDYACTASGSCPGYVNWTSKYFSGLSGYDLAWWGWIYHAGSHGTWVNSSGGNFGDITS